MYQNEKYSIMLFLLIRLLLSEAALPYNCKYHLFWQLASVGDNAMIIHEKILVLDSLDKILQ